VIRILYFARLRDELDCGEESLALEKSQTVSQLKQQLSGRGPRWQMAFANENILVAVNQALSDSDTLIKPGDEVGFFPPVTGG